MAKGDPAQPASADVFVSYSRVDEHHARRLIEFLEQQGFSVWWDGMLEAGTPFTTSTETALEQAKAVLVLWSKTSSDSHWVRDEAQSGRDRQCLVPVSIDGALPPLGFRQFQSVDLTDWNGRPDAPEVRNISDTIGRLVGKPAGQTTPAASVATAYRSTPHSAPASRSKLWIAGLAVIAAGLAFFGFSQFSDEQAVESNSLAILQFANLSDDPDQDYFSTGLSEELRQVLSQNGGLQVMGQASTAEATQGDNNPEDIGALLGVQYLLDGSVRRAGDTVRVSVQLIDASTGFDIWSETYERGLDDIFDVQSEIAGQVASALQLQMTAANGEFGDRLGGTDNTQAYDAYLEGRALYDLALDEETDRAALRLFQTAVELDPDYGAAWAALSRVQTVIANNYAGDRPLDEAYAEAIASARRAVEVAPNLAASHAALGFVYFNGRLDVGGAEGPMRQAYALGAGDADILQLFATFAARIGDFDQAREAIARAIALDPLNAVALRSEAAIHYAEGNYAEARRAIAAAQEINPDMRVLNRMLGDISYLEGDFAAARDFYEAEPSSLGQLTGLAMTLPRVGDAAGGAAALAQLRAEFGENSLYQQAQILAQAGDIDASLDALEAARAANDSGLAWLRNDPMLEPLYDESRYQALLTRIGFSTER